VFDSPARNAQSKIQLFTMSSTHGKRQKQRAAMKGGNTAIRRRRESFTQEIHPGLTASPDFLNPSA